MPPQPFYTLEHARTAYQLHYHFCWYAHGRQPLFDDPAIAELLLTTLKDVAEKNHYHLLETEVDPTCVRALISLRPEHAPANVTKIVKGNLWAKAKEAVGDRQLWSRGWFLRSVGSCTIETIRGYVRQQFNHHRAAPLERPEVAALAQFHSDGDSAGTRKSAHAAFEYNVHFVLTTPRRAEFLDHEVAHELIAYWRRVCDAKSWLLWDVEVLPDHIHLFAGLQPNESPGEVAISLMNNGAYFLERRYIAPMREAGLDRTWEYGFYAGTAGSATTAQVRSYLQKD